MQRETIGNATLYCADCREVLPMLGRVDAVITDPPYGIGYAAQPTTGLRRAGIKPSAWDDERAHGVEDWLTAAPISIIWGGHYFSLPPARGWLAWHKPDAPPSIGHFELAWTNLNQPPRQFSQSISATNAERIGHPTQKPVALMAWCLEQADMPAMTLDPYMGLGSTGVAAVRLGLGFTGIEREPRYFDMACWRIEDVQRQERLFVAPARSAEQLAIEGF